MDEWTFIYQRGKVTVGAPVVNAIMDKRGSGGADVKKQIRASKTRCVTLTLGTRQNLCLAVGLALKPLLLNRNTRDQELIDGLLALKKQRARLRGTGAWTSITEALAREQITEK